jgi:hypothetical protein
MPTVTCTLCRKSFEAGPDHCPHCHIRLPGTLPRQAPAPRKSASTGVPRAARTPKAARAPREAAASPCPACAHPITREDRWCKWCHWPVNR